MTGNQASSRGWRLGSPLRLRKLGGLGALGLIALAAGCVSSATVVPRSLAVTGAGAALERVTFDPVSEKHPSLSPDGQTLLFEVKVYGNIPAGFAEIHSTLVGVNPNTRAERTLFTSTNSRSRWPAWLPDQSSYIYTSNSLGSWSVVRALTSAPNAAVNVVASGDVAPAPAWPSPSPDGLRVAFTVRIRGTTQVAVTGLDGSRFTLLSEGREPSWSPDGRQLAFVRAVNGVSQIFLVDANTGTGLIQLTSGDDDCRQPTWSPDGRFVAFSTTRGWNKFPSTTPKRTRNIYAIYPNGTGLVQFTDGDAMNQEPHWGRDGWIYFASDQSGNLDIWRLLPISTFAIQRAAPGNYQVSPRGMAPMQPAPVALAPVQPAPVALAPVQPAPVASMPAPTASDTPAPTNVPSAPAIGCRNDNDCKGKRICVHGECVNP